MIEKRPALGKGLSALIPDAPDPGRQGPIEVDIDLLAPNEKQPRLQMDDAKLEELAQSIRENGVIQPILVQKIGDLYRIIAGERRWRAAQRAGLLKVPVVVREVPIDDRGRAVADPEGCPVDHPRAENAVRVLRQTELGVVERLAPHGARENRAQDEAAAGEDDGAQEDEGPQQADRLGHPLGHRETRHYGSEIGSCAIRLESGGA